MASKSNDIERAADERKSVKMHLDWWALIVACVLTLGLLIWQWLGGTPTVPFSSILKFMLPGGS
jgi:hypothetical protein